MYSLLSVLSVLIIISTVPLVSAEVIRGESTIPDWVKNTAGWWASEQIPDSAFLQGIQYLIKEGIMIVEIPTEIDSEAAEEVPGWVKNTVGWWAEDKIHDTTFVSGIQYLIGKGIIVVEQEVEEVVEEEVVEIKDFYMEVNGGSCSYCVNWAYVGNEYHLQIETYDEQHGKYIDGVEISAKIISKGGELRHDFGEVATDDGNYKNSIIIPSMDWYAGNILSVTGEYFGVEKTIEKEFEVFKNQGGGSSGGSGSGDSGLKMFIVGNNGNDIIQYTLATAWDVSSASFVDSFSIASEDGMPSGVAFSKSGKKMFMVGNDNDSVFEYTLATAWDVSSASSVDSFSVASEGSSPSDLIFSKSGKKMFVTDNNGDEVNEYTLSTAWDVSSASFANSFSVASQENFPSGIAFSKSGEKMFILGANGDDVNEYTLSIAWDVSTASFVDSFSVKSEDAGPNGIAFSKSGKKMFIAGNITDSILEYTLSVAWDVSSASFVDSFSVASEDTAPNGMFL